MGRRGRRGRDRCAADLSKIALAASRDTLGRPAYAFRPAMREDLGMLRRWLRTPEVARWWGDPEEEAALLKDDLDEPRMAMRIVSLEGRPFAYAQDYAVQAWPQLHFAHLPRGARAIDAFIGEPDMIGHGHGAAFLRVLAERLMAEGAPVVAIDPAVANLRARRAYEKAGFRGDTTVETADGSAVLLIFESWDFVGTERRQR
jgi:aminoglycoside 6'-N-acetyltransferase